MQVHVFCPDIDSLDLFQSFMTIGHILWDLGSMLIQGETGPADCIHVVSAVAFNAVGGFSLGKEKPGGIVCHRVECPVLFQDLLVAFNLLPSYVLR